MQNIKDYEHAAAALYDGGWRSYEKDQIREEYELDDEALEWILHYLREFEEDAANESN